MKNKKNQKRCETFTLVEKMEEVTSKLGLEKPKLANAVIKENILVKRNNMSAKARQEPIHYYLSYKTVKMLALPLFTLN
ncbi:hypothetical protein [Brevibacillus sp. DP1.3A]|uniref:hypothetical protein n=1 Tax=Brevibacillus sp. DP1.3A TaxID=2738867 RepID=UPI00156A9B7B|nr:hypothetical protein [Brevibacillus sp. DP1.3A]UED75364.1 hypothetical protein HP399_002390 [Brevibacillus sp. DP1.3A]